MNSLPSDEFCSLPPAVSDPHAHILNTTYAFITSMSLKCAVELGIPEAVQRCGCRKRPVTLADLAAALAIPLAHAPHLDRLMRMLVHAGYFACEPRHDDVDDAGNVEEAGYVLTPSSPYLVTTGGAAFVKAMLCPAMVMPHMHLSSWFRSDDEQLPTPFHAVNGAGIWEHAGRVAEFNALFNAGIAYDAEIVASDVVGKCASVVQDARSLVDVGGGNGNLARAMAKAFPHLECMVLELPHVVTEETPPKMTTDDKILYVSGNMFEYVPPADVALLKHIMHDYNDENCVKILRQCKKAISSNGNRGKVVIIDTVVNCVKVGDGAGGDKKKGFVDNQLLLDMEMLALTGGKEREEREWAKIFAEADLTGGYKIMPILGFLSLIVVFP